MQICVDILMRVAGMQRDMWKAKCKSVALDAKEGNAVAESDIVRKRYLKQVDGIYVERNVTLIQLRSFDVYLCN